MKQFTPFALLVTLNLFTATCKSKEITTKPVETQTSTDETLLLEFTKAKEGFLNESTFQVAVSSVLSSENERLSEARSIAEQKGLNLLKTYTPPSLSEKGKKELREISKEGKIIDKNIEVGGRYYFLYQIQRPGLKRLVTKDLE